MRVDYLWLSGTLSRLLFPLLFISCNFNTPDLSQQPIIQVNSSQLLAFEFAQQLAKELRPLNALAINDKKVLRKTKNQILNRYIIFSIHKEWATLNNIFVSSKELESEIQSIRQQYPDDLSFKTSLAEEGLDMLTWKKQLRLSLLQKKVHAKLTESLPPPTEKEIKSYYKENLHQFLQKPQIKVQQIVVNSKYNAEEILKLLKKGGKPEEIAKKLSITPESRNGGHLGWIEESTLQLFHSGSPPPLRQWSQVAKSPFGYHIFRILGKRDQKTSLLNEVLIEIKQILVEKKKQDYFAKWLEKQLQAITIHKDEALIQSILVKTQGTL